MYIYIHIRCNPGDTSDSPNAKPAALACGFIYTLNSRFIYTLLQLLQCFNVFQFHLHPPVSLTRKSYDWSRRSKRTLLTHDSWTEDQCVAAATATTPLTGEALDRRDGGGRPSGSVVLVATEGALIQRCSEGLFGGFNGGSVDLFGIGPFRHFQTSLHFESLFGLLNCLTQFIIDGTARDADPGAHHLLNGQWSCSLLQSSWSLVNIATRC